MIVGDKRDWLRMVFTLRGSILPRIWPRVAMVSIFALFVTWYEILSAWLSSEEVVQVESQSNRPVAILQLMGRTIQQAWQAGYVHDFHVVNLEAALSEMTNVQGGCERIKGTPIPFTYNTLIHRIVAVYCFTLPFGLFDTVGLVAPLVVCLVSYAFFGLDAIGDEVEQPFELDPNDLPLEAICRTIEINLLEMLGQDDVPQPLEPICGVLF